jgi:hypothetical protein
MIMKDALGTLAPHLMLSSLKFAPICGIACGGIMGGGGFQASPVTTGEAWKKKKNIF